MLVVTRCVVPEPEAATFIDEARAAVTAMAASRGFRSGWVGRAADDPTLWALVSEWEHVGAYRRALSSYDVRVAVAAALSRAIDEPGAFEVLVALEPAP